MPTCNPKGSLSSAPTIALTGQTVSTPALPLPSWSSVIYGDDACTKILYVGSWSLGQCVDEGDNTFAKTAYDASTNSLVFYDCKDAACNSCQPNPHTQETFNCRDRSGVVYNSA
eukprot:TRINITY_DN2101_c0_g1_i1.p2 TRINITY_DN2101_c0_g1~~TRINITY_DN2101_c0_g1_i1.p2  ORF type:complete len:114 (+),score=17.22 TRINITY_DN2101_c0_g1_i1:228-569(+)